ncbi:MAG TPA: sigma 54-interacting transcriptional regulator [Polyangiaceae bacterium]
MPQPAHRAARQRARVEDRDALLRSAEAAFEAGDFSAARELARRAVEAADQAAASVPDAEAGVRVREVAGNVRASARRLLALAALYVERTDEAMQVAQDAVRIAQGANAHREQALAELALSEIVRAQGDNVEALRWAERAKASAAKAGDGAAQRSVLAELGSLLGRMGDGERAREAFDSALALPADGQPPMRALRVLLAAATTHRSAGRYAEAMRACDRADELAQTARLGHSWAQLAVRLALYVDLGALDLARELLDANPIGPDAPAAQRAQRLSLEAMVALAEGERPEVVDRLAGEGLALPRLDAPSRQALTMIRAQTLLARGRADDAERLAVELIAFGARGGNFPIASQAMALAARAAGRPEAALLRWLGALALSVNGTSARQEHEALAALSTEAEPIGALARTALTVVRERLLERAPAELRPALKRTLRAVEARMSSAKQARRVEVDTALAPDIVRAKDEVGLVGSSPPLVRAVVTVARAARSDTSLVITGETGSGKELFARLTHRLSPRADGPFVAINCAAIPEPLLEAELFGHERGAFTGADRSRTGLFVEAQGGTLLLDEVGEMSRAMQAKLLRVLEEREVRPVGGTKVRKVDVRVIAATHRELTAMVSSGAFREDLYYRLAAITVRVPSLRERPEDIPVVARALLAREPSAEGKRLDVPALTALSEHAWPGNVRELANVLRVATSLVEGNMISGDEVREAIRSSGARAGSRGDRPLEETSVATLRARHRAELRELVGRAIAAADGNKLRAARALGISRQGLYRILAELDAG